MTKTMVSSKMGDKTVERIEAYADKEDISRSQAVEELARKALSVEESDGVRLSTDGGSSIEKNVNQTTKEQTDQIQAQLESSTKYYQQQIVALVAAFVWIFFQTGNYLPNSVSIVTGVVVIAANLYLLIKERRS